MISFFLNRVKLFLSNLCEPRIVIGKYSYGKPKVVRYSGKQKVVIGKFCSIAPKVTFILAASHRTDWVTTYPFPAFSNKWSINKKFSYIKEGEDIRVGNDVWIGYGATILSGVKIGDGAVIGANAVVAKDIEDYAIVVGNPAKEIRKRFDEKIIKKLLKIKWWNWSYEKINRNIELLNDSKIEVLFSKNENSK